MPDLDFDPTSPEAQHRACGTWVIAEQFVPKQKGRILTPETSKLQHNTGRVVSVGPEAKCGAKAGDIITWAVFKAQAVGHFDQARWFIKDEDVCSIVERAAAK